MERLHWLLERAFDEDINQLSHTFTAVTTISCLPRLAPTVMATVQRSQGLWSVQACTLGCHAHSFCMQLNVLRCKCQLVYAVT